MLIYVSATVQLAEDNKDFVMGFICQNRLSDNPQMVHLTPGTQLYLTVKVSNSNCSRRHFNFLLLKKIRLDFHVNPLPSRGFT